jgi:hypothetical protein
MRTFARDAKTLAQSKPRHPLRAEGASSFAEDRAQEKARSCSSNLTLRSQRQRLSLLVSRRRAESEVPRKREAFNDLQGTRQAVPTGEAHRLPKSVAYLSTRTREVKPIQAENAMAQAVLRAGLTGDGS